MFPSLPRAALWSILICGLTVPAAAQSPKPAKANQTEADKLAREKYDQVSKLRERIEAVAGELQAIQKTVASKRPDLLKKQQAMQAKVQERMKKQGLDEEEAMGEIMALRGMLDNEGIEEKKRQEILSQLKEKAMALQKAHDAATADPKIKEAQESFRKEMEAAMMKISPKARALLEEFYKLRKQLKDLLPRH